MIALLFFLFVGFLLENCCAKVCQGDLRDQRRDHSTDFLGAYELSLHREKVLLEKGDVLAEKGGGGGRGGRGGGGDGGLSYL